MIIPTVNIQGVPITNARDLHIIENKDGTLSFKYKCDVRIREDHITEAEVMIGRFRKRENSYNFPVDYELEPIDGDNTVFTIEVDDIV